MTQSSTPIERLDPNFAAQTPDSDMHWYDAQHLGIECRGFDDTPSPYARYPKRAQGVVRDPVWQLSQDSAGLCVRFTTDSAKLSFRWGVRKPAFGMSHMAPTGQSGLDLYARSSDGTWTYCATPQPNGDKKPGELMETAHGSLGSDKPREYCVFLPLYNGATELAIGFEADAVVAKPPAWPADRAKPIACYGTSIVQGGCASRPGMAYPAILQRKLDRPVMNLGFSGNARSEPEVADLLAELDPAAYVLDPLPNMNVELIDERIAPFVKTLRAAHPDAPILLVESCANFRPGGAAAIAEKSKHLNAAYQGLLDEGVAHLSLVTGKELLGDDDEGTVDGVHPTDLGFLRMAEHLAPTIKAALKA